MTIDKKLSYIKKALELGADIKINFHNIRNQKEAEKTAADFSELLGVEITKKSGDNAYWMSIDRSDDAIETTFFYDIEEEELV